MSPLIDVVELKYRLRQSPMPVLLDCRFELARKEAGREAWAAGHIPGARYADLDRDLSDLDQPASLGRHPLPDPARFAEQLRAWGIHADSLVVVYDHGPGALAARAWWMLRQFGIAVRLLDGGFGAWQAAGEALEHQAPAIEPSELAVDGGFVGWLDNAQLSQALHAGQCVLLDAREGARYRGEVEPIDAVAGHIPGALSRPYTDNLDGQGRFRDAATLRQAFARLLAGRDPAAVVHQCGSGVTACHNLLAMELAGLRGSRLHAPSWSGWIAEGRPVAGVSMP